MAEIFLTGATGFVGRYLVPALIRDGHTVRCLVRSAERAKPLRALGCEILFGDLSSPSLFGFPLPSEIIIHLAAVHRGSPELIYRTNADGTARLLQAARSQGARKILYLSTVTAAEKPSWPYAHSVWLAEQAIRQSSLKYTILRCSVIVGPDDPFLGGIVRMVQRWPVVPIIGSGDTKFQPISVHDVVRCVLKAISDERYDNRILTLGGPEILSYTEIVRTVCDALGIRKRTLSLPRQVTRACVRWLERLGIQTPFVPGYFLSHDHLAGSPTVIADEFGFRPQTLRELLSSPPNTPLPL